MNIAADSDIAKLDYYFNAVSSKLVKFAPGKLDPDLIDDCDILLVRSKTQVTAQLLAQTQVRYVASCVSGNDHLPAPLPGVQVLTAAGCNAQAVACYVQKVTTWLQNMGQVAAGQTAGVIGVGHVGSRVVTALQQLGFQVMQNDPVRAKLEPDFAHTPLKQLLSDSSLVSVHTPWLDHGWHPTVNLLDHAALKLLPEHAVIINAARGGVVNEQALLAQAGRLYYCLDVFTNEPHINQDLVRMAQLVTPHIAGHTWQGKVNGTASCYRQLAAILGWPERDYPKPPPGYQPHDKLWQASQDLAANPGAFQQLRRSYCPC